VLTSTLFFLTHSLAKFLRRTRAAIIIQKYQRMYVQRTCYKRKKAAALAMQCILRAYMARQLYKAVRRKPHIIIPFYTSSHTALLFTCTFAVVI